MVSRCPQYRGSTAHNNSYWYQGVLDIEVLLYISTHTGTKVSSIERSYCTGLLTMVSRCPQYRGSTVHINSYWYQGVLDIEVLLYISTHTGTKVSSIERSYCTGLLIMVSRCPQYRGSTAHNNSYWYQGVLDIEVLLYISTHTGTKVSSI